jgi:uncharacterized protein (DUF983 family)
VPKHPTYPVALSCPACGAAEFKRVKPHAELAFAMVRVCTACGTRYTPPTPAWARAVFVALGLGFGIGGCVLGYVFLTEEPVRLKGGVLSVAGGLAACASLIATAFRLK